MAQMQATRPMGASGGYQQNDPENVGAVTKATYLLGALISLALVIGMVVWGIQTLTRDVSGIPVVLAAKGPVRIQPEDPGGAKVRNQGFAVNDVAADGTAAAPADTLILAPEPLDLSFETVPVEAEAEAERAAPRAVESEEDMMALAESIAADIEPLEQVQPAAMEAPGATVTGGLGKSLRPKLRPKLRPGPAAAVEPSAPSVELAGGAVRDVDAATIPVGTRLAQLGAFKTEEIARKEWARLEVKFGDYLDGKDRVIQKAESGGRTFYRLRAMGFADLGDARRFCSALVAERAECIPVVTR